MGQCCFGLPKSPQENGLPSGKPETAFPSQEPEREDEVEEDVDTDKVWPHFFDKVSAKPIEVMGEMYKKPRVFFGNMLDIKLTSESKLSKKDLLRFEGAAFALAECDDKLHLFTDKDPYKFFGVILTSVAGHSLSHFFMDLIPEDLRGQLFQHPKDLAESATVGARKKRRKSRKSRKSDRHTSLRSALTEASEKMKKATLYDGTFTYDNVDKDKMPTWLTTHQERLLNKHGYNTFQKVHGHGEHVTQLMNLCVSAKALGTKAAKAANKILSDKGRIKNPLLTLKENPIAYTVNNDPTFESKRLERYDNNKNTDDFPDLIERIINVLDEFVENQSGKETPMKVDWAKLPSYIYGYLGSMKLSKQRLGNSIMPLAKALIGLFPDYGDFMGRNFEIDPVVRKWAHGEVDWNMVKRETNNSLSIAESDQLDESDSERKLRALLLQIYLNRVMLPTV